MTMDENPAPPDLSKCKIGQPVKFRCGEKGKILETEYYGRKVFRFLVEITNGGTTTVTEHGQNSPSGNPHPYDVVKLLPAPNSPQPITRADLQLLKWAQGQAEEMLGAQTGGPYETGHRDLLKRLETAIKKIKTYVR